MNCITCAAYDKRTLGLMQIEWIGDDIISLSSKTDYCYSHTEGKVRCKGLNKNGL